VRSELAAEAASRGFSEALAARGLAQSSLQMSDSSSDNRAEKDLETEQNLTLDRGGEAASIPRS
jgi:hypothetical protein